MRLALALLLAALLSPWPADAQVLQRIQPDKSQIRFAFKQMGVALEGRFRRFDGQVAFDPKKPEATKAAFDVELASIDLGNADGETEAKRKPWLSVDAFPKATFTAGAVKSTGPGRFEATGTLTIKGVSRPVTAPFTLAEAGGLRTVEGSFNLKRLAFRIGEGAWSDTDTVADEVTVRFKFVTATPQ